MADTATKTKKEKKQKAETLKEGITTIVKETDAKGNTYLPEMKPEIKVIKPLHDLALHIKTKLNPAFTNASKKLTTAQDELDMLAHQYIEYFVENPTNPNQLIYDDGEVIVKINKADKITIELPKTE